MDTPNERAVEAAGSAAAAVAGTAVGAVAGGTAGAVVGAAATPYLVDLARRAFDEFSALRRENVAAVLGIASGQLDVAPAQLVDDANSTEEGASLLAESMLAAAATLNRRKVRALARALALGLAEDQAAVDEGRLMVMAIAELEAPHIRCLELVRAAQEEVEAAGEAEPVARGAEQPIHNHVLTAAQESPSTVLHKLVTAGLLDGSVQWDGTSLIKGLTVAGAAVLDYMRSSPLSDEEDPDSRA